MSKRLLLADDSITIQKVIQITFAHEDYELTITDNGDTAFVRAKELVPDLVLADVYMPGKNGYELCRAIKQEPALRHIPVLLLAGSFEPFDEGKARAFGADAWIEKPFESQSLIDKVAALLSAAPAAAVAPAAAAPVAPVAPPPPAVAGPFADITFEETVAAAMPVAPPPPAVADPFADITFEEPVAAAVPPSAFAAAPDDWSDLAVSPSPVMDAGDFVFEEGPAEPSPAFPAEAELPVFAAPTAPLEEPGPLTDADEVMALGDEDILGAEDLEPIGEAPTLTPWSREETALEESFEELAAPEPLAFAPPLDPPPVAPPPSLASIAAEPPVAAAAPAGGDETVVAELGQRVATLTEAELERIVERAVGRGIEKLAGGMLERVVWEVVPDLAEALIKEEIRKIKEIAD